MYKKPEAESKLFLVPEHFTDIKTDCPFSWTAGYYSDCCGQDLDYLLTNTFLITCSLLLLNTTV